MNIDFNEIPMALKFESNSDYILYIFEVNAWKDGQMDGQTDA